MTSAAHKWKTFWSLTPAERGIARSAAVGLVFSWIGLRVLGFARWQRILQRGISHAPAKTSAAPAVSAQRIAQLQDAAAHDIFLPTNCLERSLALWFLLRRRGFAADLKFGARKQSGTFEAHAWVELDGVALNNPADEQRDFAPFDCTIASLETRAK